MFRLAKKSAETSRGTYCRVFNTQNEGKPHFKIIDDSEFIDLDAIARRDFFNMAIINLQTCQPELTINAIEPRPTNRTIRTSGAFIGLALYYNESVSEST